MNEDKEVTDTNVGNIEEDIERCKELIKDKHKEWIGLTNQKAIGNVLNNYEKIQNEIKELRNYINPSKARISYFDTKKGTNVVIEGFIPKQKIKDKIEELRKAYEKMEQSSDFIIADTIQPKIEILQELLEESEDN